MFCAYCVMFGNTMLYGKGSSSMEVFQSSYFRDWKNAMGNKRGVILCHDNSQAYMEATSKAMSYKVL